MALVGFAGVTCFSFGIVAILAAVFPDFATQLTGQSSLIDYKSFDFAVPVSIVAERYSSIVSQFWILNPLQFQASNLKFWIIHQALKFQPLSLHFAVCRSSRSNY